ncbi:MAG TPA: hypothetical protein VEV82_03210 [Actinomycetota bacterium]|nr:hypothetical protein [Actinomycetota bacterium]
MQVLELIQDRYSEGEPMDLRKLGAMLLCAMLLSGACSSGSSTSDGDDNAGQESESPEATPTTEAGPTSEDFIAEAEGVCITTSKEAEAIIADLGVPETDKANFALGKKLLVVREDRLQKLRALEASEELQAQWDDYLEVRQKSFELIRERYDVLKDGDEKSAAELLSKSDESDNEWQSIGEEIGFTACAYTLTPEDEKQVAGIITQFYEGDPQKICAGVVAKAYLDYLGGKDGCLQNLDQAPKVSISELEGIDEVTASATVSGSSYGKRVSVEVTYEDGNYKVRSFYIL